MPFLYKAAFSNVIFRYNPMLAWLDRSAHMGMWEEMEKSNQILHHFLMNQKHSCLITIPRN
jgi:hypothetical protein